MEREAVVRPPLFFHVHTQTLPLNKGLKVNIYEICVTLVQFPDINFAVCCGATYCPLTPGQNYLKD